MVPMARAAEDAADQQRFDALAAVNTRVRPSQPPMVEVAVAAASAAGDLSDTVSLASEDEDSLNAPIAVPALPYLVLPHLTPPRERVAQSPWFRQRLQEIIASLSSQDAARANEIVIDRGFESDEAVHCLHYILRRGRNADNAVMFDELMGMAMQGDTRYNVLERDVSQEDVKNFWDAITESGAAFYERTHPEEIAELRFDRMQGVQHTSTELVHGAYTRQDATPAYREGSAYRLPDETPEI